MAPDYQGREHQRRMSSFRAAENVEGKLHGFECCDAQSMAEMGHQRRIDDI
jgi:hypothetical protein